MIHVALIMTLFIPSVSDRSRGGGTAFDGVFEFDADLDGTYKLYGDKTNDPNTYIYRSGADEWTVTSGGVDALVCDASYCTFASGPMVGASIPFSDAAGTLTLQNIDALDATTETTIETAIDTLGDISTGSISQGDDKYVCQGDDTDFCCGWDTDGSPDGWRCTHTNCDGLGGDCVPISIYENGSGQTVADLQVDSVTNSAAKITVGPPGASSHSMGANQLHVTCNTEFDGVVRFDGNVHLLQMSVADNKGYTNLYHSGYPGFYPYQTMPVADAAMIVPPPESNILYVATSVDRSFAWNMPQQTDPTIVGQSADETDQTQRFVMTWNRLALGGNGGGLGCINQTVSYSDFTDDGGASGHLDLDEQIPIGADVQKTILHSLTGFTGDTTAVLTIGDDGGVDVDRYHSAGTLNVVASAAAGVDCGAPSGTTWHVAAITVRLVLTGAADFGNFSAGEATVSICYWTP